MKHRFNNPALTLMLIVLAVGRAMSRATSPTGGRDGGWNAGAGIAVVWLYAEHRRQKRPVIGKPLIAGLAAGTLIFVAGTAWLALRPDTGHHLPALAFPSLDGATADLAQFAGKPVVVNLWATWCPTCVREMPVLQAAQTARPDVVFVFLNQGEDARTVARWLHRSLAHCWRGLHRKGKFQERRGVCQPKVESVR